MRSSQHHAIALLTLAFAAATTCAQTAWTYQGRLLVGGAPANGSYSFTFKVFDYQVGGNLLGQNDLTLPVTGGLFTATLDIGNVFTSPINFWLETSVNGTTLTPRQPLTPAPTALAAQGLVLPYAGTTTFAQNAAFSVINNTAVGSAIGVDGEAVATGVNGVGFNGVVGTSNRMNGRGVTGTASAGSTLDIGVLGVSTTGYAGYFSGNVTVNGTLSKAAGAFKIDHPLDPANKYLYHSFVESPDMKNVYDGVVTTDADGYATVTLPQWFETLNRDFRYQLTVIDEANRPEFVQAKITAGIRNDRFTLRTSAPRTTVSWQVTGIRQDRWANAHRIPIEEPKSALERGRYLHPELYGQPAELSVVDVNARPAANSGVQQPAQ